MRVPRPPGDRGQDTSRTTKEVCNDHEGVGARENDENPRKSSDDKGQRTRESVKIQ